MADALANGPRQLIVAPVARARFRIRSDIRRIHFSGKALKDVHVLARAERVRQNGRIVRGPIVLRVAIHAVLHVRTRYSPRARRAGVLSNLRAVSARAAAR